MPINVKKFSRAKQLLQPELTTIPEEEPIHQDTIPNNNIPIVEPETQQLNDELANDDDFLNDLSNEKFVPQAEIEKSEKEKAKDEKERLKFEKMAEKEERRIERENKKSEQEHKKLERESKKL